jgi:hypothetical protein
MKGRQLTSAWARDELACGSIVAAAHKANSRIFAFDQFQMALRQSLNAIILAPKAGIDPVGASYPKVSCRRKRHHPPAGEETNA